MEYYYALEGKKYGPVTKDELQELIRTKKIDSKTLIWKQGMTEWKELGAFARRKATSEADTDGPEKGEHLKCSECGKSFSKENMIHLEGSWVCASCKPMFVQKLKEGVDSTGGDYSNQYGSLEKGINGNYTIHFETVISEAWSLVKGSKLILIGGMLCQIGISFGASMIMNMITFPLMMFFQNSGGVESFGMSIIFGIQLLGQLLIATISNIIMGGMIVIGVRRSLNLPIPFSLTFQYFDRFLPLLGLYVLMTILIMVGFLLLILPGIYLFVAYTMALPLMVEKKLGPWQALEASRKAVTKRWFLIFAIFLVVGLLTVISGFFFLIPLIWTIPFAFLTYSIIYRQIFGYDGG